MKMSVDDVLLDAEERMDKTVSVFADSLKGIRAGAATPGLVESIRVTYYGSQTPVRQIAQISVPDPQLIVIRPYDPTVADEIVRAIQTSDIGINPQSDGKVIRLVVPGLSEERRLQLVTRVKDMAEDARVSIRNIRRDANKALDRQKKESTISEDECDTAKEDVQKLTDEHEGKVNETAEKKTTDVLRV
jgi:ribosome recycling factor